MNNQKNNSYLKRVVIFTLGVLLIATFFGFIYSDFESSKTKAEPVFKKDETNISLNIYSTNKDKFSGKLHIFVDAPTTWSLQKVSVEDLYNQVVEREKLSDLEDGVILLRENSGLGKVNLSDLTNALNEFSKIYGEPREIVEQGVNGQSITVVHDNNKTLNIFNSEQLNQLIIGDEGVAFGCSRIAAVLSVETTYTGQLVINGCANKTNAQVLEEAIRLANQKKCTIDVTDLFVSCPPGYTCRETHSTIETRTCNVGNVTVNPFGCATVTFYGVKATATYGVTRGVCDPISPTPTVNPSITPVVIDKVKRKVN